jgi:hypothetical protein
MFIWASQKLYPIADSAAWPIIISGACLRARRLAAAGGTLEERFR